MRAILFDLMGTLLVSRPGVPRADGLQFLHSRLQEAGLASSFDRFLAHLSELGTQLPLPDRTPFEQRIGATAEHFGLRLEGASLRSLADAVTDRAATFLEVDAAARALLEEFAGHYRLGLVTNYDHPPAIHRLLREHALDFASVVISGEVGLWKPDPAILLTALNQLGDCSPADAWYVGDSVEDMQAAVAAGMGAFLVARPDGRGDPLRTAPTRAADALATEIQSGRIRVLEGLEELPTALQTSPGGFVG